MAAKNNRDSVQSIHQGSLVFLMLAGVAFLAVASYAAFVWAQKVGEDRYPARTLPVSAEGSVNVVPDVAEFSFSVITEGEDLGGLQDENAQAMRRAGEFLVSQGIPEQDIKTTNYSIRPRYQYFRCPEEGGPCPPPEIVGYSVTQTAQVKIKNSALNWRGALRSGEQRGKFRFQSVLYRGGPGGLSRAGPQKGN